MLAGIEASSPRRRRHASKGTESNHTQEVERVDTQQMTLNKWIPVNISRRRRHDFRPLWPRVRRVTPCRKKGELPAERL